MVEPDKLMDSAAFEDSGPSRIPPANEVSELRHLNRVIFGAGALAQIGSVVAELGVRGALLVTDPGVQATGQVERAREFLRQAAIPSFVFDAVEENPTAGGVERGAAFARQHEIGCIIGMGGGSPMDVAKGINFLLTNGGCMEDYWGTGKATKAMLPSIGIPMTAGTGSEAQSYALIEQEDTRRKMACGDKKALFQSVILDPELTASMPRQVAALSGMDAISHAIESYVTVQAGDRSRSYARAAWSLLEANLEASLDSPANLEIAGRMLYGAHLAGAAIELSMLGAAHACANPLTSRFGVAHGAAVLLMLPHVIRFNESGSGQRYRELMQESGQPEGDMARRVEALREATGLPARLRDIPIPAEILPKLASEAAEQWTAQHNPQAVGETELRGLYELAY